MNEFQQAISSEEVWRENMLWFSELDCAKNFFFFGFVVKLRQSNIIPSPTKKSAIWSFYAKDADEYIQENYQGFISQVYISHMVCGHLMGALIYLNVLVIKCVIGTPYTYWLGLCVLGGVWESHRKSVKNSKLLLGIARPTFGTSNNNPTQLCWTGYQPRVVEIIIEVKLPFLNNMRKCLQVFQRQMSKEGLQKVVDKEQSTDAKAQVWEFFVMFFLVIVL